MPGSTAGTMNSSMTGCRPFAALAPMLGKSSSAAENIRHIVFMVPPLSANRMSQQFNCECCKRDPGNRKQYCTSPEETEPSDVDHGMRGARIELDSSGNLGNAS